jgi:hypothetical protein
MIINYLIILGSEMQYEKRDRLQNIRWPIGTPGKRDCGMEIPSGQPLSHKTREASLKRDWREFGKRLIYTRKILWHGINTNALIDFTFRHPDPPQADVSGSRMNWFWMLKQVQHDTLYNTFTLVI